jgi:hypothetical protein
VNPGIERIRAAFYLARGILGSGIQMKSDYERSASQCG